MTIKKFYIIIGKSGSGKGTQAKLLQSHLSDNGYKSVRHITTGGALREFVDNNTSYSAKLMRDIMTQGKSLPDFVAIWNWYNIFIDLLDEEDSIILDGAPRKSNEAKLLDEAVAYYGYSDITVIYIDVTDVWAIDRLSERGRSDDSDMVKIKNKMEWFATDVLGVIDWYKNVNTNVKFVHVNGENSIEEVFSNIKNKI